MPPSRPGTRPASSRPPEVDGSQELLPDDASPAQASNGWRPRTRFEDHAGSAGPPTRRECATYAAGAGLAVGLGIGLIVLSLTSIDYVIWKDVPVERALVIKQEISATKRVPCGKAMWANTPAQVTTFSVPQPRSGLPGTFVISRCEIDERPGDTVTVQRVVTGTEDDVMLGPKLTPAYLVKFAGIFAVLGFTPTFVWLFGRELVRPRWQQWLDSPPRKGGSN